MTILGIAIDKSYVSSMPEYLNKEIGPKELGDVALRARADKQLEATKLANGYKEEYGNGISTEFLFYNASGYRLRFHDKTDGSGHIGKYPYDTTIENGQWSVVLHTKTSAAGTGSVAVVEYEIEGADKLRLRLAWHTPFMGTNTCYARIAYDGQPGKDNDLHKAINDGHSNYEQQYANMRVSIGVGDDSSTVMQALLRRE